jgi:O-acetylserine/cysteine efflux transporter
MKPVGWLTDASLLFVAIIWGANVVIVKFATTLMPALAFNAARIALAAILLVGWASALRAWPDRRRTLALLALGVLGNGIYQMFFVFGVKLTRAGDAAVIAASTPAFIAMLSRLRGHDVIGRRTWSGIGLAILGVGLVSGAATSGRSGASLRGDALILGGSVSWATYTVLLKPYTQEVNDVTLSALTMTGGAIALSIVSARDVATTAWGDAPTSAYVALVVSAIAGLIFAYMFWYRGVRILGATRTAMYSYLQPVFAVLIAWAFLGEVPTAWQGVGAASILSGLMLSRS